MKNTTPILPPDFDQLSDEQKRVTLSHLADEILAEQKVVIPINNVEYENLKEQLKDKSIALQSEQEKKKEAVKKYNDTIKGIKKELDPILQACKFRVRESEQTVYMIRDQENSKVYGYTSDGIKVVDRMMEPHERQTTIKTLNMTGN